MNKDVKEQKTPGRTRIHNARFYNLAPRAINCMDYNKLDNKLTLARNDGSIEIWDIEHTPFLEKTAPKIAVDKSIQSIVWAGKYLFSAGITGEVTKWNTTSMMPCWQQRVTGNAIWCLAVNRQCTELAIGTEEGYINIFNIENDEFQYKLLFDKQEGRVLCCSYDASGNYLVTGSINALRVWNARTGHAVQKMTLPKSVDNKDTIIWTVKVLEDFSIIAGDSRGCITVYDGHHGDHLESHQVLKADVLALDVSEARDMLICSGVEPIIRIYARTQIKREDTTYYRWVKYLQRAVHDHDVKSLLCVSGDRIISGGVDGYLGVSFITRMRSTISKQGPFLKHPFATVAVEAQLLLLRYPEYLEIWRLGSAKTALQIPHQTLNNDEENEADNKYCSDRSKSLALGTSPVKLLEFRSKNDETIMCASISPNGKMLCYSTAKEVRFFNFFAGTKEPSVLQRIKNHSLACLPMSHICFSHDSQSLFLVSRSTKQMLILEHLEQEQENDDLTFVGSIDLGKHLKGCITLLKLSPNGKFIVLADDDHKIAVWRIGKANEFKHLLNLPRYDTAATTAIAVHANIPRIVVAFSDSRIVEYDLEKAYFTCWFDQAYVVPNTETHCVSQILLDERNPDIIILQNDGYLYTLEKFIPQDNDKHSIDVDAALKKRKTTIPSTKNRKMSSLRLKFQKPYEHLVHTSWLSSDDLVTVSVNQNLLVEQLPPAFRQKKYGKA